MNALNLTLGHIKGIKVQIHFTFWLVVIFGAFQYGSLDDVPGLLYGAFLTLTLFSIVLLHELGHSFAALFYKIPVRDITLLPIGGLARLERMPDGKPIQELVIAIAGPAVNFVIAIVMIPVLWLLLGTDVSVRRFLTMALSGPSINGFVTYLFAVNLSLLVFNMIPAFPLDGGRILRAFLALFIGTPRATQVAVFLGRGFAILLGIFGLYRGNFFTAIIAVFIFSAGGMEGRAVAIKSRLKGVSTRQAVSHVRSVALQPNFTIMEVASMTLYSHQRNFPVMLGDSLVGVIRRRDIRQALKQGSSLQTVTEIMQRDIPRIHADTPLVEAQEALVQSSSQVAAVYEDFQFLGLLSFEDIERLYNAFSNQPTPSRLSV
ncbi:MAG: site-2 protease family protein [Chloroflexota bacterium]